ncbi:MAG: winged helix-turn-helix domain-containing protein [Bacteroidota bacterium]
MNVKNQFEIDKVLKMSLLCFLCIVVVALVTSIAKSDDPLIEKQVHLAVRAIGDELLTTAHNLNSPVQPVQEVDDLTLRLSFKDPMPINPDSLAELGMKYITPKIAPRAIVSVLDVASGAVVYGFEINHLNPKEIPCLGRILPESTYYVDISVYEHKPLQLGLNTFTFGTIGLTFASFALLGISFFKGSQSPPADGTIVQIKGIKLDLNTNQMICSDEAIKLTNKETQILSILCENEGQLVSRAYLTEEVWLKQGVVTSRSLDMYISRLRKKLKGVSNAQILNQHGKGYILKVE